jgi:hypothetical protein
MTDVPDHDRDHDRDDDDAIDSGEHEGLGSKHVAPAPVGGALTSLAALSAALANVPVGTYLGRTGLPMLLFKSRQNGTWMFGQRKTIPEPGSKWAVNPTTFSWGYVSFGANNKRVGEVMVPVSQSKPDVTKLPVTDFPWQNQMAVNMKCISGVDSGVEVIFKATTDGALSALDELLGKVRNQIESEKGKGKTIQDAEIAPYLLLENDSYPHREHGKTFIPVMTIVGWMPLSGPIPTPVEPTPGPGSGPAAAAAEQPRRRRVA